MDVLALIVALMALAGVGCLAMLNLRHLKYTRRLLDMLDESGLWADGVQGEITVELLTERVKTMRKDRDGA